VTQVTKGLGTWFEVWQAGSSNHRGTEEPVPPWKHYLEIPQIRMHQVQAHPKGKAPCVCKLKVLKWYIGVDWWTWKVFLSQKEPPRPTTRKSNRKLVTAARGWGVHHHADSVEENFRDWTKSYTCAVTRGREVTGGLRCGRRFVSSSRRIKKAGQWEVSANTKRAPLPMCYIAIGREFEFRYDMCNIVSHTGVIDRDDEAVMRDPGRKGSRLLLYEDVRAVQR